MEEEDFLLRALELPVRPEPEECFESSYPSATAVYIFSFLKNVNQERKDIDLYLVEAPEVDLVAQRTRGRMMMRPFVGEGPLAREFPRFPSPGEEHLEVEFGQLTSSSLLIQLGTSSVFFLFLAHIDCSHLGTPSKCPFFRQFCSTPKSETKDNTPSN